MIIIARKYKQVHRKELTFDLKDWEKIEYRAEACHTDTTKYLRTMILEKQPIFYDMKEIAPLLNGMRIISHNINQVARKANETNSVTAGDVEKMRKEVDSLFHVLLKTHNNKTHVITSLLSPCYQSKKPIYTIEVHIGFFDYKF